jgi:hypothetical protein
VRHSALPDDAGQFCKGIFHIIPLAPVTRPSDKKPVCLLIPLTRLATTYSSLINTLVAFNPSLSLSNYSSLNHLRFAAVCISHHHKSQYFLAEYLLPLSRQVDITLILSGILAVLVYLRSILPAMNDDVVAQFTEFTGSSPELATQYLHLADYSIEQAMQLYFDNGGAPLTDDPVPSTTAPQRAPCTSGVEGDSGVVHVDSDDEVTVDETRSAPSNQAPQGSTYEDDEAMARRLQEEMYGGGGGGGGGDGGVDAEGVRAPIARTTETLVGPEADFNDDDMHTSILGQLRARQQRG